MSLLFALMLLTAQPADTGRVAGFSGNECDEIVCSASNEKLQEPGIKSLGRRPAMARNTRTNNNALLTYMKKKESIDPVDGGRTIVQELEYAENGTYQRYSGLIQ